MDPVFYVDNIISKGYEGVYCKGTSNFHSAALSAQLIE
jgi:hypothetical protein